MILHNCSSIQSKEQKLQRFIIIYEYYILTDMKLDISLKYVFNTKKKCT